MSEQTERDATAESRALSATEERERATAKHAAEVAHLREQAEGNERHLLARIEDQKMQTKRIATEREKEAAAAQGRISALETSVSESSKLLAATRGDLATAHRDLTREQSLRAEVEAALINAQERLTKEQLASAAERERVKAELLLEQSANKHLRQERDEAMCEAARQEGKTLVLLEQLEELRGALAAQQNSQNHLAKAS